MPGRHVRLKRSRNVHSPTASADAGPASRTQKRAAESFERTALLKNSNSVPIAHGPSPSGGTGPDDAPARRYADINISIGFEESRRSGDGRERECGRRSTRRRLDD